MKARQGREADKQRMSGEKSGKAGRAKQGRLRQGRVSQAP
jgi:hypothetical protein